MAVTDAVLSRRGTLTLCKSGTAIEISISPSLRTNNAHVLIEALKAGRGIGPVQLPLVIEGAAAGHFRRTPTKTPVSKRFRDHRRLFTHGVIRGACHTKALGISSPGIDEAILMGPRSEGEDAWSTMSGWTSR